MADAATKSAAPTSQTSNLVSGLRRGSTTPEIAVIATAETTRLTTTAEVLRHPCCKPTSAMGRAHTTRSVAHAQRSRVQHKRQLDANADAPAILETTSSRFSGRYEYALLSAPRHQSLPSIATVAPRSGRPPAALRTKRSAGPVRRRRTTAHAMHQRNRAIDSRRRSLRSTTQR